LSGTDLAGALAARPLVLDGGLSTELERRGHDISGRLWSARLLADAPTAIRAVHAAFLAAGADVVTTASYQAGLEGLLAAGYPLAQARGLIRRSVELARDAVGELDRPAWVAGSVGPYGAMLADGSEYTGDYGADVGPAVMRAFHRPRLELLAEAGADVLAAETVPSLAEAEALTAELDALGVPAWLSMTAVTGPDGVVRTRRGEPAEQAWAMAAHVEAIVAVGVNCVDPAGVAAAVQVAARASGKPVVAYPNSGEGWDAVRRRWVTREPAHHLVTDSRDSPQDPPVAAWLGSGARLIGGCCRVTPAMIGALAVEVAAGDRPAGVVPGHPQAEDRDGRDQA
jgi:S-methylmethionine-dependent homocysteine/selenocysteine methylase